MSVSGHKPTEVCMNDTQSYEEYEQLQVGAKGARQAQVGIKGTRWLTLF